MKERGLKIENNDFQIEDLIVNYNENIEKIAEEKEQLAEQGEIRKSKSLDKVDEEEKLYDLPFNWEWTRLGNIGAYRKGPFGSSLTKSMFVPKSQNTVKVYEQKNAIQKNAKLGDYYITQQYFEQKMKSFLKQNIKYI